ncbi:MAG: nucleotidyltransferase domain-containing protein [Candidatus Woesearchaeota archaeon]
MRIRDIKTRIKEYFLLNPTAKMRVRQLERAVKVPLPSAIRYTKELEKEGIIKVENIGGVNFYSANRISQHFLYQKKMFNFNQLFSSGLVQFLIEEFSNPTIVLFGSYSRGEDLERSDIDIYLETTSKKKVDLTRFEKLLDRKIQIFHYKKIHQVENKELRNNIVNGMVLNGFLEVF